MKKEGLVKKIKSLQARMQKLVVEAGVSEDKYNKVFKDLEIINVERQQNLLEYLENYAAGSYKDLVTIWNHQSEEAWRNQALLDLTDSREAQLLMAARKAARKNWYNPNGKKRNIKTAEGSNIRSEETGTIESNSGPDTVLLENESGGNLDGC